MTLPTGGPGVDDPGLGVRKKAPGQAHLFGPGRSQRSGPRAGAGAIRDATVIAAVWNGH